LRLFAGSFTVAPGAASALRYLAKIVGAAGTSIPPSAACLP